MAAPGDAGSPVVSFGSFRSGTGSPVVAFTLVRSGTGSPVVAFTQSPPRPVSGSAVAAFGKITPSVAGNDTGAFFLVF